MAMTAQALAEAPLKPAAPLLRRRVHGSASSSAGNGSLALGGSASARLSSGRPHPAIFIDKDGTLIPDLAYNVDPDRINLHPFAARGLRLLQMRGYALFLVSNQSGVAREIGRAHV